MVFTVLLTLLFVHSLEDVDVWLVKKGVVNWLIAPYLSRCIVLLLLLGVVFSLFLRFKKSVIKLRWYWLVLISFVSFVALNSIEMLEQRDFEQVNSEYTYTQDIWQPFLNKLFAKYPDLTADEFLLANYSVSCRHCNDYAYKISATLQGYKSSKKVVFHFWGTDQEIEDFLVRNESQNIHYIKSNQLDMFNLVGNSFPVFQIIDNGTVKEEFFSGELNNFELNQYFKK